MKAVSAAWDSTIRGSHRMVARARVCTSFQTGADPDGTDIPIFGGDVQFDATAEVRATLDMSTDGTERWPSRTDDLFAPYGHELFVERGVQYADDTVEYVPLGYYRIQGPEQDNPPDGPIRLAGRDRMAGIIDARLMEPRQFAVGYPLGFIVEALVQEVYPDAVIAWDDATDSDVLTRAVIAEESRYGFINDLVRSRGKAWYWDGDGTLVIRSAPDPAEPVFEVNAGEDGVLVAMSRRLTRDGVYNAVVAQGEGTDTDTPVRAVAVDANPDSATFFGGSFGPVPRFYSSPFITTTLQAANAASALLRQNLGLPYSVDLSTVANPALEPDDPVRVFYSDRAAPETHVLQRVTIPLTYDGALTATTREQTVVLITVS